MGRLAAACYVWTSRVAAGGELDLFTRTLDGRERTRAAGFVRESDRRAYVTAHGLLRLALSWAEPSVAPAAWRFREARYGKPELADDRLGIRFSVSHCPGHVAVALSGQGECGVDVECAERAGDLDVLVGSVLGPRELARFRSAPAADRGGMFFRSWTLKEAYTKAVGLGLRMPFYQLDFGYGMPIELLYATTALIPIRGWSFDHWTESASSFAVAFRQVSAMNQVLIPHHEDAETMVHGFRLGHSVRIYNNGRMATQHLREN
jgi:4'-phosphopantetheinyl transferase